MLKSMDLVSTDASLSSANSSSEPPSSLHDQVFTNFYVSCEPSGKILIDGKESTFRGQMSGDVPTRRK